MKTTHKQFQILLMLIDAEIADIEELIAERGGRRKRKGKSSMKRKGKSSKKSKKSRKNKKSYKKRK